MEPQMMKDDVVEVVEDGTRIRRDVLFARPPQRQVSLVERLGLAVDEQGYLRVSPQGETSIPGIYAAGDLTTPMQAAIMAAAAGALAGCAMNHGLILDLLRG